jgi:membrane protein DedA with SNARE-associated domain
MTLVSAASSSDELGGIAGFAVSLMERFGSPGAGLAVALENLFPPLPSELILPLAGFAASRGDLSLVGALIWTTAGSVGGALILYGLGAVLGRDRMRALATTMPLVKVSDVDKSEEWFARHGRKAVFFGRMIPIFRSFISIPAGIERMPLVIFCLLTLVGSAIWNSVFIGLGYALGENWERVEGWVAPVQNGVIVVVLAAVCYFIGARVLARWREQKAS